MASERFEGECPPCPDCKTDVLVARYSAHTDEDWICYGCDQPFATADVPASERGQGASS